MEYKDLISRFMNKECFTTVNGIMCNGDARELIKLIPDQSIDVVITDPPWGVGFDEYDDDEVFYELEDEYYRVLKNDAWFIFYYSVKKILKPSRFAKLEYVWMIPYMNFTMGAKTRNRLGSEQSYGVIMVFKKGNPKVIAKHRDVIFSDELPVVIGNIKEPLFKPTGTTAVLFRMFTRENDIVLDPFAGYGSIPLISEIYNRRWIGFEIDRRKYTISKKILTEKRVVDISKLKNSVG